MYNNIIMIMTKKLTNGYAKGTILYILQIFVF